MPSSHKHVHRKEGSSKSASTPSSVAETSGLATYSCGGMQTAKCLRRMGDTSSLMNGCRKSVKIRRGLLSRNETSTAPSSKRNSCQNVVLKLLYPWVGISVETAVMFDGMVMLETKRAKHACKPNTVQFGGSCDLLIPPQSLDQQLI